MINNAGFDPSDFLITAFVPPVQAPPVQIQGTRSEFTEMLTQANMNSTTVGNNDSLGKSSGTNETKSNENSLNDNEDYEKYASALHKEEIASNTEIEKENTLKKKNAEGESAVETGIEDIVRLLAGSKDKAANDVSAPATVEDGFENDALNFGGVPLEIFAQAGGEKTLASDAAVQAENDFIPFEGDSAKMFLEDTGKDGKGVVKTSNETASKSVRDAPLPEAREGVFMDRGAANLEDVHIAETSDKADPETKEAKKNERNNVINEKLSENLGEAAEKTVNSKNNDKNTGFLNDKNAESNKNLSNLKKRQKVVTEVSIQTVQSGGGEGKETTKIIQLNGKETEITVNLRSDAKNFAVSEQVMRDTKPQVTLENFLARELHQNLNGDIVRQASVMLREGGSGTIRLSLKPESLGNVKIMLEMSENKIQGHITVESNEAMKAFTQELKALEQTFRDNGYENATLTLDQYEQNGAKDGENRENVPFLAEKEPMGRKYEENSTGVVRPAGDYGVFYDKTVNIFA
ncbi:hypothetical protein FACS1894190_01380 [Spirochaetia bacterium]|nr:hypothetical protein FACS1894190_01380 [Spirochaetia bacterium]